MSRATIRYAEVTLYEIDECDTAEMREFLDKAGAACLRLFYNDPTECIGALATWGFGKDNTPIDITFPILIFKDIRFDGPPVAYFMCYARTLKDLPSDFKKKAERK